MTLTKSHAIPGISNNRRRHSKTRWRGKTRRLGIETLESRHLLAVVGITLETTNLAEVPVSEVNVGEDFLLRAFVQDLRAFPQGVFAAYMDVTYDSSLVSVDPFVVPPTPPPSTITFAPPYVNGLSGDSTTPGLIDEVGASDGFSTLSGSPFLMFSIVFTADTGGTATFVLDPADDLIFHPVLLIGLNTEVDPADVDYGSVSIEIVDAGNQPPTDITLSNAMVDEHVAIGTVIGTLSATDPDTGETFTFSEVTDPDGKFSIVGTNLKVDGTLDFETQTSHNVTIRVVDSGGLPFDKTFTITVKDVNEIDTLTDFIPQLQSGGAINGGNANALLEKLENAQDSLDTGNTTAAANQIQAFINQVNALRNSGKLTDAQADELIEKAGNALGSFLPGLHSAGLSAAPGTAAAIATDDVLRVVDTAIAAWQADHIDTRQLPSVNVYVADLPGSYLGLASPQAIWIDADAAGYGWSLDAGARSGGVDLLSAVTHELGHVLGFDHNHGAEVMGATLAVGQRLVQPTARLDTLAGVYLPFSGIALGSLTPLDTVSHRTSLDAGFGRARSRDALFTAWDGLAMRREDEVIASRPLAQPLAIKERASEMGDAKLLNAWNESILKDDLSDDESDWSAAVDQAISELMETTET